jgi:predicted amidophosphoribosyltransferase
MMNEPCNNNHHMIRQICPDCGACASHIGDRIDGACRHCGSTAEPTSQHRDPHSGVWVDGRLTARQSEPPQGGSTLIR